MHHDSNQHERHRFRGITPWALLLILCCHAGLAMGEEVSSDDPSAPRPLAPLPVKPPEPDDNKSTPEKVTLGEQLFFDPRLSGDGSMSCATCHDPEKGWGDGLARAEGHGGKRLDRNTPTTLNVGFHDSFFWDGRVASLEEQALEPIRSPDEMNQDLDELVGKLQQIPEYARQFQDVFGTEVTTEAIGGALAAFQRTLVSTDSPFDRYLAGDKRALSPEARRGLELFQGEAGCIRCHDGPLLSDGRFHRLGVSFTDEGRAAVTGNPEDRARFRTPSLRDVAETGPYMHNGSIKTLDAVIEFYLRSIPASGPDGLTIDVEPVVGLSYSDVTALVAFLRSLSGTPPPAPQIRPATPE
jgi:cytochrome c peroxidase